MPKGEKEWISIKIKIKIEALSLFDLPVPTTPNASSLLCKAKSTCYLLDPRSKAGVHEPEARRFCVSRWEVHFVLISSQDS